MRRFLVRIFAAMVAMSVSTFVSTSALAQTPAAERCAALMTANFSALQDAPTEIVKTEVTRIHEDLPEVCQITAKVDKTIGVVIAMPMANWNGKLFQTGCGGACGTTKLFFCDEPLKRGYACVGTDMGHEGAIGDWKFTLDLKAFVDFGFRATHRATLAGKAITETFYTKPPARSYFGGCSTGGRQALVAAQHFPYDFDGIIAGSPASHWTGAGMQLMWSVLANQDKEGKEILDEKSIRVLHKAVMNQCDAKDGLKDNLITDPRQCKFDPRSLVCKAGATDGCISTAQADAAAKIYAGPSTSTGTMLYPGGMMRGSELHWLGAFVTFNGKPPLYKGFVTEHFRYGAFSPPPGASWQMEQFDFDRDYKRLGMVEPLVSGSNPDLRRFKANGGKIIGYQGWDDNSVEPMNYLDYYQTVTRTMGGAKNTTDFYRLFMVPGMRHCSSDSTGADAINYLEYLEQWVEKGHAPDMMLGYHVVRTAPPGRSLTFPPTLPVDFTRPHYPYPSQYRYNGRGDPNDAANFSRVVKAE